MMHARSITAVTVLLLALALVPAADAHRELQAATTCKKFQVACGGKCVNPLADANNCGKCKNVCAKGFLCRGGGCVCPGWRPNICSSTCVNTNDNAKNCGFCGNVCPSSVCQSGKCLDAPCGNKCTGGTVCVNGACICPAAKPDQCGQPAVCVNKMTDAANCGFCGGRCTGGKKCVKGACK